MTDKLEGQVESTSLPLVAVIWSTRHFTCGELDSMYAPFEATRGLVADTALLPQEVSFPPSLFHFVLSSILLHLYFPLP